MVGSYVAIYLNDTNQKHAIGQVNELDEMFVGPVAQYITRITGHFQVEELQDRAQMRPVYNAAACSAKHSPPVATTPRNRVTHRHKGSSRWQPVLLHSDYNYTLYDKMNARLNTPLYAIHIPDLEMGQKQNRKRTRHRPSRSKRQSSMYAMNKASQSATNDMTSPKHTRSTSYIDTCWPAACVKPLQRPQLLRQESATSRDRRMFGGDDDDTKSAMDLRGPMLDVVLGLFNGIDYDDALV
ncbi:hypothetical protein AC579_2294 [Pseudocercospora musae]|uniref:Uncharacterized protein n=1 Tax=Pseudocercospora musae TaxID=113226 RepID=A0A139IUX7_9PEZI|nr:hypothetical protein AC579_2294 [Pseudocercospora musae]